MASCFSAVLTLLIFRPDTSQQFGHNTLLVVALAIAGLHCPAHNGITVFRPSCPIKMQRPFALGLCACDMCGDNWRAM